MGPITKLVCVALPALAGCASLSPLAGQGAGVFSGGNAASASTGTLPATYKGPRLDFSFAQRRARDFYEPSRFFAVAGVTSPWLEKVPMNHAHFKNGFLDLLKDGDRKLSLVEIESARDAVIAFANHDTRCDLKLVRNQLNGVARERWGEVVAQSLYATSQDALRYVGIAQPSRELTQLAYAMTTNTFANRNFNYDDARGKEIVLRRKRWLTLAEWIEDPRGVCTEASGASVNLIRQGAKSIETLNGLEAANASGNVVDASNVKRLVPHSVTSFRINKNFVFVSDGLLPNAPLSAGEIAFAATKFCADFRSKDQKFFHMEYPGGDRPGIFLNLGNSNMRYQPDNLINVYKENPDEYHHVERNSIFAFTDFYNWQQENPRILLRLDQVLSQYRQ